MFYLIYFALLDSCRSDLRFFCVKVETILYECLKFVQGESDNHMSRADITRDLIKCISLCVYQHSNVDNSRDASVG